MVVAENGWCGTWSALMRADTNSLAMQRYAWLWGVVANWVFETIIGCLNLFWAPFFAGVQAKLQLNLAHVCCMVLTVFTSHAGDRLEARYTCIAELACLAVTPCAKLAFGCCLMVRT